MKPSKINPLLDTFSRWRFWDIVLKLRVLTVTLRTGPRGPKGKNLTCNVFTISKHFSPPKRDCYPMREDRFEVWLRPFQSAIWILVTQNLQCEKVSEAIKQQGLNCTENWTIKTIAQKMLHQCNESIKGILAKMPSSADKRNEKNENFKSIMFSPSYWLTKRL